MSPARIISRSSPARPSRSSSSSASFDPRRRQRSSESSGRQGSPDIEDRADHAPARFNHVRALEHVASPIMQSCSSPRNRCWAASRNSPRIRNSCRRCPVPSARREPWRQSAAKSLPLLDVQDQLVGIRFSTGVSRNRTNGARRNWITIWCAHGHAFAGAQIEGTSAHRQLSISSFMATKVSARESADARFGA